MIIREIIMWLSIMRSDLKDFPEVGSDNKIKALSETLVIIHKYEKIKQIVDRPTGNNAKEKAYSYMMIVKDIKEVLEDDSN